MADIAVLSVQKGRFGFTDMLNTKVMGPQKLVAELTLKDGKIVYDLNGLESLAWDAPPGDVAAGCALDIFPAAQNPALARDGPKRRPCSPSAIF